MRKGIQLAALFCATLAVQACGGSEESRVPNADEQRRLDEAAAMLDENEQTIDTSPDSLTAAEAPVGNEAPAVEPANSVAAAPAGNTQ